MENSVHYLELTKNPIRFVGVSQLTNVFFDDSNKQIFAVRSGGTTGVVVKGPTEDKVISFCMSDRGTIRFIKFSPDNQILAVQRQANSIEFLPFKNDQPVTTPNTAANVSSQHNHNIIIHQVKAIVYGFVWIHNYEVAVITNTGIEIVTILTEKNQIKPIKSMNFNIKWFAWCTETRIAILCTNDSNNTLLPILIKQKTITKLPKVELSNTHQVQESKVTLGQIYGVMAILILQASTTGMMEVEIYLLNGPGLAARKCHVLRLGLKGLFAINVVDNLIVVHHQASATSLLFDISLNGEVIDDFMYHTPITTPRSIRPFALKLPSLSPDGVTVQCELYSTNWVLFQPNIVIDAKLGCMWYLNLIIDSFCTLISDRIRLTEFLLQRGQGKQTLLKILKQLVNEEYNGTLLPVLETIFNKINKIYACWLQLEVQNQTGLPSNIKTTTMATVKSPTPPKVLIEQVDMADEVFQTIAEKPHCETILLLYLQSLNHYNISLQEELSKMLINELIRNRNFETLQRLECYSLLLETKAIACHLLSHSNEHPIIIQVALNILHKIKATDIIIEVLLGQGKVIDALRLANNNSLMDDVGTTSGTATNICMSARKFLEAAYKTHNDLTFYNVFRFFQNHNFKQYGNMDFLKSEQCAEFIQYYNKLQNRSINP